jgi:hypothetical protein
MTMNGYNHYRIGSYLLIGFAPLLILAAVLTDPQEYMQSPFLMLSATCFIGGGFLFALSGDKPIDARLAGRLSVQGIPTLGHIIRDMGGSGPAVFLPPESEGGSVTQFTSTRSDYRSFAAEGGGFTYHNGSTGILTPPLAAPLLDDLKNDSDLALPKDYSLLMGAIREVCEETLSVTEWMDIRREGDRVIFTLHNYLLFSGCASLHAESPEFCMLCPCSICSLIACMIAEGLGCAVSLNRTALDDADRSLRVELSCAFAEKTPLPA